MQVLYKVSVKHPIFWIFPRSHVARDVVEGERHGPFQSSTSLIFLRRSE